MMTMMGVIGIFTYTEEQYDAIIVVGLAEYLVYIYHVQA